MRKLLGYRRQRPLESSLLGCLNKGSLLLRWCKDEKGGTRGCEQFLFFCVGGKEGQMPLDRTMALRETWTVGVDKCGEMGGYRWFLR